MKSTFDRAHACWRESDPEAKCNAVHALVQDIADCTFEYGLPGDFVLPDHPGRPRRPVLVDPRTLPRRGFGSPRGHAAFIHAICHIEFSAINLALDAALRFKGMPMDYYRDWLRVAGEEATHFGWLSEHLVELGYCYGDFVAHDGLWVTALNTRDDVLRRMALVPRVLEARGLDVTPAMIERLVTLGDDAGAAILTRILADEIGHVAIGSRWFEYLAAASGDDPSALFVELVGREFGRPRGGEVNLRARSAAGFSPDELRWLAQRTG